MMKMKNWISLLILSAAFGLAHAQSNRVDSAGIGAYLAGPNQVAAKVVEPVVTTVTVVQPAYVPPTAWYVTNAGSYTFNCDPTKTDGCLGTAVIGSNGSFSGSATTSACLFNGLIYSYDAGKCLYTDGIWYPVTGPGIQKIQGDYNFLGSVTATGSIAGSWAYVSNNNGTSQGSMNGVGGSKSGSGNFTAANGSLGNWIFY